MRAGVVSSAATRENLLHHRPTVWRTWGATAQQNGFLDLRRIPTGGEWLQVPFLSRLVSESSKADSEDWSKYLDGVVFLRTHESSTPFNLNVTGPNERFVNTRRRSAGSAVRSAASKQQSGNFSKLAADHKAGAAEGPMDDAEQLRNSRKAARSANAIIQIRATMAYAQLQRPGSRDSDPESTLHQEGINGAGCVRSIDRAGANGAGCVRSIDKESWRAARTEDEAASPPRRQ